MPNAWFLYVCPLAICVVFVVGGIVMLRRVVRGNRESKPAGKDQANVGCAAVFSILILMIGTGLGVSILTSPSPWARQRISNHVLHTPPERIERFVILP